MTKLEKQLERFIISGFKRSRFTKDLYSMLYIDTNVFIAHFNIDGFYKIRFEQEAERTIDLLTIVSKNKPELRKMCHTLAAAMTLRLKPEVFVQRMTSVVGAK